MTAPAESGVWVFYGDGASSASAVFTTIDKAEVWISEHKLSGVLTWYPLDIGVYQWVIASGCWKPKREEHREPRIIQGFCSYLDHHHYVLGRPASEAGADAAD